MAENKIVKGLKEAIRHAKGEDVGARVTTALARDPFERIERENCKHEQIQFGSGDYYIFCHACGSWWAHVNPENHQLWPEGANRGVGSVLSGEWRKAY